MLHDDQELDEDQEADVEDEEEAEADPQVQDEEEEEEEEAEDALEEEDEGDLGDEDDQDGEEAACPATLFGRDLVHAATRHGVSQAGVDAIMDVLKQHNVTFPFEVPRRNFQDVKRHVWASQPRPLMDVTYREAEGNVDKYIGLRSFPKSKLRDSGSKALVVRTYFHIADLSRIAKRLHSPQEEFPAFDASHLVLSSDGVPISKSGGVAGSLNVVCLRFRGCRQIYPLIVVRVKDKKYKLSPQELFGPVIQEIKDLGLTLEYLVADAPERAFARCQKNHSGYLSCDLCTAHGRKLKKKKTTTADNPDNISTGIFFPNYVADRGEPREITRVLAVLENLETFKKEENAEELCCGYTGVSPFVQLPGFDIVQSIPVDIMHLVPLGVVKKLFQLCTENNKKIATKLAPVRQFVCKWIVQQRVPRCFTRRPRDEFTHFKASEWRSLCLLWFPLMVEGLSKVEQVPLRQLWLFLPFIVRAHLLDTAEWQDLEELLAQAGSSLRDIGRKYLEIFQDVFGKTLISYNMHIFGEHMPDIRARRPLLEASAFPFESAYGQILKTFTVGTESIGKQSCLNMVLLATLEKHRCETGVSFHPGSSKSKAQSRDDLVQHHNGKFYMLDAGTVDGNRCTARRIKVTEYRPRDCPDLLPSFEHVNVHCYKGLSQDPPVVLDLSADIKTKAVLVLCEQSEIIMAIPVGTMTEN
jgi:hypothetical protein